jgi:hypothetical protein
MGFVWNETIVAEETLIDTTHWEELQDNIDYLNDTPGCPSNNSSVDTSKNITVDSGDNTTVHSSENSNYDSGDDGSYDGTNNSTVRTSNNSGDCMGRLASNLVFA